MNSWKLDYMQDMIREEGANKFGELEASLIRQGVRGKLEHEKHCLTWWKIGKTQGKIKGVCKYNNNKVKGEMRGKRRRGRNIGII